MEVHDNREQDKNDDIVSVAEKEIHGTGEEEKSDDIIPAART